MNLGSRGNQHSFSRVPDINVGRSSFDRSYTVKTTMDFDYINPIHIDEVIPGDTHTLNLSVFARLATPEVPIMDNMYIDFFFFFVPNRLVWTNWERFNGAQDDPGDSTDFVLPQMPFAVNKPDVGSIFDQYGLPTEIALGYNLFNVLPLRGYPLIWNEWFRDENLQNSQLVNKDDGPDDPSDYTLLKRGKRHDYFTSCLPELQKGDPVDIPLVGSAPVVRVSNASELIMYKKNTNTVAGNGVVNVGSSFLDNGVDRITIDPNGTLQTNLSGNTAGTINDLRNAFMVQSILELDNRGGTRYTEIIRAHFGVISPDARLQRPEYLGGGSIRINSHPVAQTSPTSGTDAQGALAAFATASATSRDNIGFSKTFTEHGYIHGFACARADITYQQGINRMWNRSERFDFFWPKLQLAGEQAVEQREIYLTGNTTLDYATFGYQERYSEYKYKPSEIRGKFRSTYATPLDMWHLAEEFGSAPALNAAFITQSTPIERAIAIDTEPDLLMDMWFQLRSARPMASYAVPATLGRF